VFDGPMSLTNLV